MEHSIREISINDADDYIKLIKDIYDESDYMLYSPGEYVPSLSSVLKILSILSLLHLILFTSQKLMVC